jgi:asparagine synthase (glutamine-hydrolysing)
MNQALEHRGPDDEGIAFFTDNESEPSLYGGPSTPSSVYASQFRYCPDKAFSDFIPQQTKFVLGHRRLSILDLSAAGHQPMCTEDGRYWIVYNGEIYNFREIRTNLIKLGEHFKSKTDTEVLLKAYRLWGKDCLSMFNGMWAFAIYDRTLDTLFISRDRFGKKPLYYYIDREFFAFASEIKAILRIPLIKTAPDIPYCSSYIENGCQEFGRSTAFQNIFRFSPGAYVELRLSQIPRKNLHEKKFWKLTPNLSQEPFNEKQAKKYSEAYYNLLLDAVRIRLRADVLVGSALSGGLDSSSIVYLINQLLEAEEKNDKQITFSSVYKSKEVLHCDESGFINNLAKFLHIDSKQIEPRSEDIPAEHRRMIYAMDTPPEGTLMSSWHTFICAKSNRVKVTIDGQGADEMLAGYLFYIMNYILGLKGSVIKESGRLFQIPGAKILVFAGLALNLAENFISKSNLNSALNLVGKKRDPFEPLNHRLAEDTFHSLLTLIHYADRTSMAHSIESRMPFMDYRLVEYLAAVPACYKIHKGWTKYIARLAMDRKLPNEITWRKDKMGWPIPEKYWFQNPLKDWFCKKITDSHFLKQLGYSQEILGQCVKGNRLDKSIRLLNLAVWHDVFFNKQSDGSFE